MCLRRAFFILRMGEIVDEETQVVIDGCNIYIIASTGCLHDGRK